MKKILYLVFILAISVNAFGADTKGSALTADATPGVDSGIYTIDGFGVTPLSRVSTIAQVLGASPNIAAADGTIEWEDAAALEADGDLSADIVDSAEIADDAIDSEHYTDGSIDLAHMSAESIDSDQYVDASIDLAHMSVNSVDSDQYVDGSIDVAHMSVNSIDSDQYVDASIDLAHMSAESVDSDQYVDASIDLAHLAAEVAGLTLTNITSITNRAWTDLSGTNWRMVATNGAATPTEIVLGADGTYLMSNGADVAPTFESVAGSGTMTTIQQGDAAVGGADIIVVDFNAGAFSLAEDPNTEVNVSARRHKCVGLEDLSAADDDISMGDIPYAVTITKMWCKYFGTGTTPATILLEDGGGTDMQNSDASNEITCVARAAIPSEGTGLETMTTANLLIAYETLQFDVTNTPAPTTDDYTICVEYTID